MEAGAIVPFRVGVLGRVALGNVAVLIENPDGFGNVDEVVDVKAFSDQRCADRGATFDVLCAVVVDKALTLTGGGPPTDLCMLLEESHCMACILQDMSGSKARAARADNGYGCHLMLIPIVYLSSDR